MAAGRMFPATAPTRVPIVQPMTGVMISPYIYRLPTEPSSLPRPEATANTSSVFTNDITSRCGVVMVESSFCDIEIDISAYRRLITSWASASSMNVPALVIIGTAASCPAEVTLVKDMSVAWSGVNPELTQKIPKAKATEK